MRPPRVLGPTRLSLLVILLTVATYADSQTQQHLLCKNPDTHNCLLRVVNLEDFGIDEHFQTTLKINHLCGLIDKQIIPSHGKFIKIRQIEKKESYKKIFCNKIVLVGRLFDLKDIESALLIHPRVRRQTFTPRGRYRGQTQSQYLTIDRGNGKDDGRAEAHSAADSSRASVSGNSGMGQAQSQSMYDPNCDDCNGKFNHEIENLKRPTETKPGTNGYGTNAGPTFPINGGFGPSHAQNGGYNPSGINGYNSEQKTPGIYGSVERYPSKANVGNFQTNGIQPTGNRESYGPNSATSNGFNPNNGGGDYRPGIPSNNGYTGGSGPESNIGPGGYRTPNGGTGSSLGSGDSKNKQQPDQNINGFSPSGSQGFQPNSNTGVNRGPGGHDYISNQDPNSGKYSPRQGETPGGTGGNFIPRRDIYESGFTPNNIHAMPDDLSGSKSPGIQNTGTGFNPRQVGNFAPNYGNGATGSLYGPDGRLIGSPSIGTGQTGSPNINNPIALGPYPGLGGNVYCCVVPNAGQTPYGTSGQQGTLGRPDGHGGYYNPSADRSRYIPNVNTGTDTPGAQQYVPEISGGYSEPGRQYIPASSGGSTVPGGRFIPGGTSGSVGPGGQYTNTGSSIPGDHYIPARNGPSQIPGGQYIPSGSGGSSVPGSFSLPGGQYIPGTQYIPSGTGSSAVPESQYVPGGIRGNISPGGQYFPDGTRESSAPGGQFVTNSAGNPSGPGGQYTPSGTRGSQMPGEQYIPGNVGGSSIPGGQYVPGGSRGITAPDGQYATGGIDGSSRPGGHYIPSAAIPGGQYMPGSTTPGGQYIPGASTPEGRYIPGATTSGSQYIPGATTTRGQYTPGGTTTGGQYTPGGTATGGHYTPVGTGSSSMPGGQYVPDGARDTTVPGSPYTPSEHGSARPGGQYIPGGGSLIPAGQYVPGGTGISGPVGQYTPGGPSGSSGPGGQYIPSGNREIVPGEQYIPGRNAGSSVTGGQYIPSGTGGSLAPGEQYLPNRSGGSIIPGKQYAPGGTSGTSIPGGQHTIDGTKAPTAPGDRYSPGGVGGSSIPGGQYIPSNTGGSYIPDNQYTPSGTRGTLMPSGQYPPDDSRAATAPGDRYAPGSVGGSSIPGGQYIPGSTGGTSVPGGQYGPSGTGTQGYYNQGGTNGQNVDYNGIPQNYLDPNTAYIDGDDSEAIANVAQNINGTTASASSKGGNDKGRAQTSVQGTYTGSGSFQAQAQITGENKEAQSEVSGGKKGASSTASGSGRNNKSQANVQLGSETGSVQTQSQSNGVMHSSTSQVQGSVKGGMADAQARGPGSTSSQAQIGFTPFKDEEKSSHDLQQIPFTGGGLASAQSSGRTGQSQSQLHGTFKYGISYNGAAQSGASLDKDAVFPNRLSFEKINVFDEKEKKINVDRINVETTETPQSINSETPSPESTTLPVPYDDEEETGKITTTENIVDESMKNSESRYSEHTHIDHHVSDLSNSTYSNGATLLGSRRSFQNKYGTIPDYEFTTDKEETQPEYDTEVGFENEGNDASEVEQNEYSNYDEYPKDPTTHQYLQSPNRKRLDVQQTTGGNTQHIILGSLKDHNAEIIQKDTERPDESKVYQPGERVPGTGGYTIPVGFTGSVKSVASKDKTYVVGSKDYPSQAQSVTLTPGTGKIKYTHPSTYGKYVKPKNLRSLHSPNENDNRYVSVSKSVTRALDSDNNIRKQYSHTYYTKSSSCGYFTFTCTMVSSAEGRKKVCKPKMPTNPDGTPIRC